MNKVKITVLKTTLDKDLAAEYGAEGLSPCPMMKTGQVFYADYAKPDGFCDEAWKSVRQLVTEIAHGADKDVYNFENHNAVICSCNKHIFYFGKWIRQPGVAICSCNDGLRPVIFKLEATDEESKIDYVPVR